MFGAWDNSLENPEEYIKEQARKMSGDMQPIAAAFARMMEVEGAEKAMAYLRKFTVDATVAQPGLDPSWAFYREGQNNIVRHILTLVEKHNSGEFK